MKIEHSILNDNICNMEYVFFHRSEFDSYGKKVLHAFDQIVTTGNPPLLHRAGSLGKKF
jgi:hypothetical protein